MMTPDQILEAARQMSEAGVIFMASSSEGGFFQLRVPKHVVEYMADTEKFEAEHLEPVRDDDEEARG